MATRWSNLPGLNDDVVERSIEDYKKVQKSRNVASSNLKGGAREAVREAGARAGNRLAGRAGAAGAALQGGYELGRAIDERTGVGKRMVEGSETLKRVADRMGSSDHVKLSGSSKARIADMENDRDLREVDEENRVRRMGRHGGEIGKSWSETFDE